MKSDPVTNAIYNGVKRGIQICLENECFGSAVILIYSGVDTMASLAMTANKTSVTRDDFIQWCEKYIRFSCPEQITGQELYSARCGMLHSFGVESGLTRDGRCRKLAYMDHSIPEIRYSPDIDPDLVLVSIDSLAKAFYNAIDRFLVDLFADSERAAVAELRLENLVVTIPTSDDDKPVDSFES